MSLLDSPLRYARDASSTQLFSTTRQDPRSRRSQVKIKTLLVKARDLRSNYSESSIYEPEQQIVNCTHMLKMSF